MRANCAGARPDECVRGDKCTAMRGLRRLAKQHVLAYAGHPCEAVQWRQRATASWSAAATAAAVPADTQASLPAATHSSNRTCSSAGARLSSCVGPGSGGPPALVRPRGHCHPRTSLWGPSLHVSRCSSSAAQPASISSSQATHDATPAPAPAGLAAVEALPPAPDAPTREDEIARRIASSRARRAARLSYNCPACSISTATPANMARHVGGCCPDLVAPDAAEWERLDTLPRGAAQHDAVVGLLRAAGAREMALRRQVLATVFWSGPLDVATGLPTRLGEQEAAARLGLPPKRFASLLARAMASVPLASDPGGPLDVVYEDHQLLAVNKPVGLHTAPIHRFTGGSVVNRVIAYLNRGRKRSPGEGSVTLLSPPPVLDLGGRTAPHGIPELLPVPEPFTDSSSSDDGEGLTDRHPAVQLEPYVLHRLDMNTSGLLLFAKRPEVVAGIHRQFRDRTVAKLYLAATVGSMGTQLQGPGVSYPPGADTEGLFHVDAPIDRHPSVPVARMVASTGKEASTSFAVLARSPAADLSPAAGWQPGLLFRPPHERTPAAAAAAASSSGTHAPTSPPAGGSSMDQGRYDSSGGGSDKAVSRGASLVVCAPHTGRTHQIRVHLDHVGHPILGDDLYGITGPLLSRQALHAACLSLQHPLTGQRVTLSAPLHDDMATCLAALGLPVPDTRHVAQEWGGRLKGPDGGQGGCGGGRSGGRGKGKEGRRGRRGQGNGDCGRGEVEGQ